MNLNVDPDWLLRMAEKEANGIISVGGLVSRISQAERASMTTYPTASELRAAANLALVAKCDDPLLGEIMEAAKKAARTGALECRIEFPETVDGSRRESINDALDALGLFPHWSHGDPSMLSIKWQ